jgi:tryptophan synthase alpha subunit
MGTWSIKSKYSYRKMIVEKNIYMIQIIIIIKNHSSNMKELTIILMKYINLVHRKSKKKVIKIASNSKIKICKTIILRKKRGKVKQAVNSNLILILISFSI